MVVCAGDILHQLKTAKIQEFCETVGNCNFAVVEVFAPQKPANTINQSPLPPHTWFTSTSPGLGAPRKRSAYSCVASFNFSEPFMSHLQHGSVSWLGLECPIFVGRVARDRRMGVGLNAQYQGTCSEIYVKLAGTIRIFI